MRIFGFDVGKFNNFSFQKDGSKRVFGFEVVLPDGTVTEKVKIEVDFSTGEYKITDPLDPHYLETGTYWFNRDIVNQISMLKQHTEINQRASLRKISDVDYSLQFDGTNQTHKFMIPKGFTAEIFEGRFILVKTENLINVMGQVQSEFESVGDSFAGQTQFLENNLLFIIDTAKLTRNPSNQIYLDVIALSKIDPKHGRHTINAGNSGGSSLQQLFFKLFWEQYKSQ